MPRTARLRTGLALAPAFFLCLLGCREGHDVPPATGDGSVAGHDGGGIGGNGGGSGMGLNLPDAAPGGAGGNTFSEDMYPCLKSANPACAGQFYMGRALPLDIFVMFDRSGSLEKKDDNVTRRIDYVRDAVISFLQAPESSGIGVGIGYFGDKDFFSRPGLTPPPTSCDPATYATPAIPMDTLPGNAAALIGSLKTIEPISETPTGAAVRGACTYAKGRKQAVQDRNIIVLLVTDGLPAAPGSVERGCNPTLDDAIAASTECSMGGIKTYVLGVGPNLTNLNGIAAAGGTKAAYLVESGGAAAVLKALNAIRNDAQIPCTLQIPKPTTAMSPDFGKVNVLFSDQACKVTTFVNVREAKGCDASNGGWYYDNAAQPSQIHLCGASCEQTKALGGQLVVSVGCMTRYNE